MEETGTVEIDHLAKIYSESCDGLAPPQINRLGSVLNKDSSAV